MEWLNFRHLYAFWMVARTRNFTRAAEQIHVAQSAVSAQVASLEEYLGEQLLIRSNRSVELTPVGRELLGYAQSIFEESRAINAQIKEKAGASSAPRLRIGIVAGASRNFIFRMLEHFVQREPSDRISVSTGSYEELYGLLKRFELDMIITLELPRKTDMGEITYQKLGDSPMCIAGAPAIIRTLRRNTRRSKLDVFKFRHPHEVGILDEYVRPRLKCELELRLDTDDIPLLRFFASTGDGIVVMPRVGVLEDIAAGTVDYIELRHCPDVQVYGIFMPHARGSTRIESLLELSIPDL